MGFKRGRNQCFCGNRYIILISHLELPAYLLRKKLYSLWKSQDLFISVRIRVSAWEQLRPGVCLSSVWPLWPSVLSATSRWPPRLRNTWLKFWTETYDERLERRDGAYSYQINLNSLSELDAMSAMVLVKHRELVAGRKLKYDISSADLMLPTNTNSSMCKIIQLASIADIYMYLPIFMLF